MGNSDAFTHIHILVTALADSGTWNEKQRALIDEIAKVASEKMMSCCMEEMNS
jgi:hypothetical protein